MHITCYFASVLVLVCHHASALPSNVPMLPDVIRRAADAAGIDYSNAYEPQNGSTSYVTDDLLNAYKNGDHGTISRLSDLAARDMDPIYANIKQNKDEAWNQVTNPSTNTPYWISVAGDPENPTGFLWSFTLPLKNDTEGDGASFSYVVQCGTLSTKGQYLGISTSVWEGPTRWTADALATVAALIVGRFIFARLVGSAVVEAASVAVAEAGAVVIGEGLIAAGTFAAVASFLAATVIGGAIAIAVFFLVLFLSSIIFQDFTIAITVYNWSDKLYNITTSYGDNEKIAGDAPFVVAPLWPPRKTIKLPSGLVLPTKNYTVSTANYNFVNDRRFLDGVGVAMQATREDGDGFQFKYIVHRVTDNELALGNDLSRSIKDYYKDNNLAPRGTYQTQRNMKDGTWLKATTNALGGREDKIYQYFVHIGIDKTLDGGFEINSTNITQTQDPPVERRPYPQLPAPINVGQQIAMPGGAMLTVRQVGFGVNDSSNGTSPSPSVQGGNATLPVPVAAATQSIAVS